MSGEEKKSEGTTKELRAVSLRKVFDVTVYPNPSNDYMTLSFDQEGEYVIELLSKQGRVLQKRETTDCEEQINVTSLKQGLYYLRVSSRESVVTKKVFIE